MFGIDIIDAGLIPSMLIALIAGIFSFLSPCVLPIVPPYLAYMGGISMQEMENDKSTRRHTVTCALFFTLGLSTVFILLGIAVSALGQFMLPPRCKTPLHSMRYTDGSSHALGMNRTVRDAVLGSSMHLVLRHHATRRV